MDSDGSNDGDRNTVYIRSCFFLDVSMPILRE